MGYKTGDCIGMELDLNKYTLSYFKNGRCLGKAFDIQRDNKSEGFMFAVSMAVEGDCIAIANKGHLPILSRSEGKRRDKRLAKEWEEYNWSIFLHDRLWITD